MELDADEPRKFQGPPDRILGPADMGGGGGKDIEYVLCRLKRMSAKLTGRVAFEMSPQETAGFVAPCLNASACFSSASPHQQLASVVCTPCFMATATATGEAVCLCENFLEARTSAMLARHRACHEQTA